MLNSVFVLSFIIASSEELTVHVKQGPIRSHVISVGMHEVYFFKNIPYAKQPIGNLRFQLPQEHEGWLSKDDLQANAEVRCPQYSFYIDEEEPDSLLGQEDCLFLDIYVRKDREMENVSLPVAVYFHGGRFHRGSKEDYGPDFLLRYNDIILVIPNYRLGILGFLSFDDAVLPGNLGLWDQNAALKWVSENIAHFGGDPERVTIAGHEAGGASVGLHILASASHDYFQGAVSGSGTALSPWLVDTDTSPSAASRVAEHLRCPKSSDHEMMLCLKAATLREVLKVQGKLKHIVFLPTVDSDAENSFIPFPPAILYQRGYQKNVNYLIGFTENEASYEVGREFPNVLKYQHLDKMIHHFLQPYFKNALNFEMIVKAAKYHYLRGIKISTFESIEPEIAKMMTDFLYKTPLEQVIKLHHQKTANIFYYIFKGNRKFCGLEDRRCFGNEYYVFNTTFRANMMDLVHPDVERTTETISEVLGNFITLGYPDVHNIWKPLQDVQELQYVEISDIVLPEVSYGSDDSEFWTTLVSDLNAALNASEEPLDDMQPVSEYSTIGTWGVAGLAVLCGVLCVALVGLVVITKRRTLTTSIVTGSSTKDVRIFNG